MNIELMELICEQFGFCQELLRLNAEFLSEDSLRYGDIVFIREDSCVYREHYFGYPVR